MKMRFLRQLDKHAALGSGPLLWQTAILPHCFTIDGPISFFGQLNLASLLKLDMQMCLSKNDNQDVHACLRLGTPHPAVYLFKNTVGEDQSATG